MLLAMRFVLKCHDIFIKTSRPRLILQAQDHYYHAVLC